MLRNRGIDGMYDADTMPGAQNQQTGFVGIAGGWPRSAPCAQQIRQYAADNRKFFMTYVPAAPHNPFDGTPDQFQQNRKIVKLRRPHAVLHQ